MEQVTRPDQPDWISHYLKVDGRLVPVARPFAYGGSAREQRLRRIKDGRERTA